MKVEKDVSKQIELVREALIEENKAAESRLQAEKTRSLLIQQHSKSIEAQLAERSRQVGELQVQLKDQSILSQQKVDELEGAIHTTEQRSSRVLFLVACGSTFIAIVGVGYFIHWIGANRIVTVSIVGGLLLFWFIAVRILGSRNDDIKEWPWFKKFAQSTVAAVITLIITIVGNAVWDVIKALFSK